MVIQRKAVAGGALREWELDLSAMKQLCGWAGEGGDALRPEVEMMLEAFPTFVAAVGVPIEHESCYVDAAEPLLCPTCEDELVVFDRGTRCAACGRAVTPPNKALAGFVGRIPALISGRPFRGAFERRLQQLQQQGDARFPLYQRCLLQVEEMVYLAPRFSIWFGNSFPHSDPPVMVWPEYFPMLDIPPDHVYPAPPYHRLCLYARWLEQPACSVLQKRVVPRLLIDLMLADLQALGQLDRCLRRLDTSLYEVYHMVGGEESARLRHVYGDLIQQSSR